MHRPFSLFALFGDGAALFPPKLVPAGMAPAGIFSGNYMARKLTIDVMCGGKRTRLHVTDRAPFVFIPQEICNALPYECSVAKIENTQSRKEDLTTLPNYQKGYFDE